MYGYIKGSEMEAKSERKTLTITEASEALGVSRNKAYEAARRGEILTIRIGKRILVPVAALERMLQGAA
jgi:excisionase family DNA binding protein